MLTINVKCTLCLLYTRTIPNPNHFSSLDCIFMEELKGFLEGKGLTVSTDPIKGRCLFTTKDFSPGQVIIAEEPYVCVPKRNSSDSSCHRCFKSSNLKKCSACQVVWYCGSTCQKLDWKMHRLECHALSSLDEKLRTIVTPSIRLMVKVYLRRKLQNQKIIPTTAADNYNQVETMVAHMSGNMMKLVLYAQKADIVKRILQWPEVNMKEIIENFCKLACNALTIHDSELNPLGKGLYPIIAIINHSCLPNAVLVFEGQLAVIRAVQHIPKGAEVLISYIDTSWDTQSRQEDLQNKYHFTCTCSCCTEVCREVAYLEGYRCKDGRCNGFLLPETVKGNFKCQQCGLVRNEKEEKKILRRIKSLFADAVLAKSAGNIRKALSIFIKIEKIIQNKVLISTSTYLMQTRNALLKALMKEGEWQEALAYCKLTIPVFEKVYPGFHPSLGLQYYTSGKLEWHHGNTQNAVELLTKALDILRITHGTESPFTKDLSMKLEKARAGESLTLSSKDVN